MAELVYIDNSNLFIEGKRVSAVKQGRVQSIDDAIRCRIFDNDYRIDFGCLHNFIAGDDASQIKRAVLFGSRPPENDSLWEMARRKGFEPVIEDRNPSNKEKRIDTGIVTMMMQDAYKIADKEKDTLTLVAGDGDYVPTFEALIDDEFKVDLAFWGHVSSALKNACTRFFNLDKYLDHLRFDPK